MSDSKPSKMELARLPLEFVPGDAAHSKHASNKTGRPSYEEPSDTEVHLLDYVRVLSKRRWTMVTVFLVTVLAVATYTFTATPIYEAKVQILIEKEASNVTTFKEAIEQNQATDDYYQTQYKILQSRGLARRTVETLNLWTHPQFIEEPKKMLAAPIAWVSSWVEASKAVKSPPADEIVRQSAVLDRFLKYLVVLPVRNSRLVEVRFESEDPALAAQVANSVAKGYIEQSMEFKYLSSKEASDWLSDRLGEQRKQVEASEQALQQYREQTDSVSLEEKQNVVVQKLADLNAAVTRAKTERIQKQAAYDQIRAVQNDKNAIDTIPAIVSNVFIQQQKAELAQLQQKQAQLAEKLGPRHPDMVKATVAVQAAEAKIQGEIAKVVQSVRNDYQQSLAQERSLTSALEQQKSDALALNRKGIEYGVLTRDAASNRQIFDGLMQRTKETGISGELRTSNIRILDAAEVPGRPASPNTPLNLLLALFGGTTLAVGFAFFFEYIDNRIKTPDEITAHLRVPFLGMVPALFDKKLDDPLLNNGVPANFSESFRAIRTNVLFSFVNEGCRSVVITSSGPSEGKTMVATNVAVALAQTGQRVLIIDADMRRPRVHLVFGLRQEPGLSNVLVGSVKIGDALATTDTPGLWVLPSGVIPPNPAELLGSKYFKDFLTTFGPHFDWVIIDTPPVMAVTDAAIVAHTADGLIFVVGAEMTSRHAAQRAIEQLERAEATFVGAILNRVDLKHQGYYYSHYYRREYADYYQKASGT